MLANLGEQAVLFLSTPSARRATRGIAAVFAQHDISIHALREEGDYKIQHNGYFTSISIHALREEGNDCPKVWGHHRDDFYPRPPRGGRRYVTKKCTK